MCGPGWMAPRGASARLRRGNGSSSTRSWPPTPPTPTLAPMASTAKIDPPTDSTPTADPFAWDPDPMVLVSRRNRVVVVPTDILRGEMSPEQVKRWSTPISEIGQVGSRQERQVAFVAGVNFLGAHTSVWALRGTAESRRAPHGPRLVIQLEAVSPHKKG